MTQGWEGKKNILCIRLDNMGDVIMSGPAMRALKENFRCNITLLTSSMAAGIAPYLGIDDVIVSDVPWVKSEKNEGITGYLELITTLRKYQFDAAVIFTVFSQNPMPAIMLAYLAGIPRRLAYCRENPYDLLTDWVPEQEPYTFIKHQVTRDLDLVAVVGATTNNKQLKLNVPRNAYAGLMEKINNAGINIKDPWIVVHPCASEEKREYPANDFRRIIQKLIERDIQLVFTGVEKQKDSIRFLIEGLGGKTASLAGELKLEELIALIDLAPALLSVNTGTVHIAAALKTPVVVLYALTKTQHTPWMTEHKVFAFPVKGHLKSRNEVLRYVDMQISDKNVVMPDADEVVSSVINLLQIAFQQPV